MLEYRFSGRVDDRMSDVLVGVPLRHFVVNNCGERSQLDTAGERENARI